MMGHTPPANGTILVVDDEPAICSLIRHALAPQGYTILLANNGRDALQLCTNHKGPIQLLLTDLLMPGMNGLELAAKVQALRPQTRVLYLSESSLVAGGFANEPHLMFLPKPFTLVALVNTVRKLLNGSG
jgi:two-component system cell cycle sensor histidine kinase/response regulator CckA